MAQHKRARVWGVRACAGGCGSMCAVTTSTATSQVGTVRYVACQCQATDDVRDGMYSDERGIVYLLARAVAG